MAPKDKKGGKKPLMTGAPIKDPRFAHVHRDPRFMKPQKQDSKVTVDSRFSSMLTGKEFSSAPKVDKYGRKLQSKASDQQMKRFYQLQKGEAVSDDEDNGDDDEDEDEDEDEEKDDVSVSGSEEEEEEEEGDDVYDPMRGRGVISGSDSDSESDMDEDAAAELDREAEDREDDEDEEEEEDDVPRGDESHRFACVNLDWDHVKSTDLFKVFSGFKPEKGAIRSVKIYPSEFGKERLEREEREGPPPEIFKKAGSKMKLDEDESSDEEEEVTEKSLIKDQTEEGSEEIDNDALRQYQLDRLKYYYAVVDCDSVETAKAICEACDGAEYESSANFFDLRYIPDGMEFDDTPRDESFGAPENYKPNEFTTQVFQHSNVKLTWDEDDADRIKVTRQKFSKQDLEDMDFKAYLASSDEEDSEDEDDIEAARRKYRALLSGGNKDSDDSGADSDDDKNQEMEITFAPGLSEAAAELLEAKKQREQPVKEETSIETYKRKEKERHQRRKEARAAKLKGSDSEEDSDDQGGEALFSDDEDERLMNDSYFAEEFAGGDMMPGKGGKKDADKKGGKGKKKDNKKRTKEERLEDNRKKAELELLMEDNRESNQHFNMKEIQKAEKKNKKKNKKAGKGPQNDRDKGEDLQDDFKIDVKDPRFSALHESHHFALDPTNPNFKKTKAMTELMQERQKRTATLHEENEKKLKNKQQQQNKNKNSNNNKQKSNIGGVKQAQGVFEDPSLSLLVDTVKRKSAMATEDSRNGKRSKKNK
ncbi:pre-rRNA-processing protein esf1 [Mortierella sp. NVP41]|nr:pre-rRNA-processing protein esf1 [Mortierella sp. NVP41]